MITRYVTPIALIVHTGIVIATSAAHADGYSVANSSGTYSNPPPPPPPPPPPRRTPAVAAVRG